MGITWRESRWNRSALLSKHSTPLCHEAGASCGYHLQLQHKPRYFPGPTHSVTGVQVFFILASKRGERKVRKGAPAAPGNYYCSSSSTQEYKQFLESTFVKRQLHECQQLTGSLHFMAISFSGLFSCFSYYGPQVSLPRILLSLSQRLKFFSSFPRIAHSQGEKGGELSRSSSRWKENRVWGKTGLDLNPVQPVCTCGGLLFLLSVSLIAKRRIHIL